MDDVEAIDALVSSARDGVLEAGTSVHLHCTDVDGEWVVRMGDDGTPVVTREHAKGDAAIRGSAQDLLMVLQQRQPLDSVDVVGDRAVAERFVRLLSRE